MTPMTTTRPTIVRTRLPPPAPPATWWPDDLAEPSKFSGVDSPPAASAAGASRSRPRTAAPAEGMAGEIRIHRGLDSGWESLLYSARCLCGLSRSPAADLEALRVDHRAGEQDERQHVEPEQGDQHEHRRRPALQAGDVVQVEREPEVDEPHRDRGPQRPRPHAAPRRAPLG